MRSKNTDMTYNNGVCDEHRNKVKSKAEEDEKPKKRPYTKRKREEGDKNDARITKRVRIDKKWIESENVDIDDIVNHILLSVPSESKSSHTVFSLSEWETAEHIVQMLFKECPTITKSKMDFALHMSYLYDRIMYN